jgi:hypothetical protein
MPNPMIKIVNAETGEEIERPMNAAEFKQYQDDQALNVAKIQDRANQETAKQAILDRLGLTAAEAALLLK